MLAGDTEYEEVDQNNDNKKLGALQESIELLYLSGGSNERWRKTCDKNAG